MGMRVSRVVAGCLSAVVAGFALSGCDAATDATDNAERDPTVQASLPPLPEADKTLPPRVEPRIGKIHLSSDDADSNHLLLTTWGSSSCPNRIEDVKEYGDHTILVTLSDRSGTGSCTADLSRTEQRVKLPRGLSSEQVERALVSIRGARTYEVPVV